MSATEDWRRARDEALIVLERSQKPADRASAAEGVLRLAEQHPERWEELAPAIPRMISDKQEEVRRGGIRLGALMLHPDEAEPFLTARLSDPVSRVRMEAAGQLADLARPSARGALAALLEDPSFAVRFEAARGIAALQHPAGLEVLLEALDKNDLRFRALGALGQLADPRALPNVRAVFKRWLLNHFERTQAAAVLARLGDPEGQRYLIERTKVRRAVDRMMAVELLGELEFPGAIVRLLELLDDRRESARGAAARGLGRSKDPRAEERLVALAREDGAGDELVLDAIEGLCHVSLPRAKAVAEELTPRLSVETRAELTRMLRDFAHNEEEDAGG